MIPNERLAAGILRNDTLEADAVGLDVSVWLPADADVPRALDALREETGHDGHASPRPPPRARASPSAANACRRPSAPSTRPSCASAASRRLRADGVLGG